MLGQLLEHVIKESNPGCDAGGFLAAERYADVDMGFLRLAQHSGATDGEFARDARPSLGRGTIEFEAQPAHTKVARQLHVRIAIANHSALLPDIVVFGQVGFQQSGFRLAAVAVIGRAMRADTHGIEAHALRAQCIKNELLAAFEVVLRERICAQTVLIGDHH